VARSVFWLVWSRGVVQLLAFVTTVLVARILAPADYGVMALASAFIGAANTLAEMGLGRAIIQFRDLTKRELDTCFWITMALASIGYAVLSLGARIIAHWFSIPQLAEVLPILALVLPLTACSVVSDSLLRQRLALDRISQAEIVGGLTTLPVVLSCAFAGLGVWALVIGAVLYPGLRSIIIFALAPWRPGFRIGGPRAKDVLHFSLTTLGANILWSLGEQADLVVIGKITGQATTGLYSMGKQLALLPGQKMSSIVNTLNSPIMAELQTNIDAMRVAFYRTVRLTAAITLPVSTGMMLVADELVAILLGPQWAPMVPVLRLLCLYAAVRSIDALQAPVLYARYRERLMLWYCLGLLVTIPAAVAVGAVWRGATGAVLILVPAYCALAMVMIKVTLRQLKGGFLALWLELRPVLAATVAMAGMVLLLRVFVFAGLPESGISKLILLSLSGALTYGLVLLILGREVVADGLQIAGWIRRFDRLV
jgi:O-antigen/teichoic acid export membrane protein